MFSSISSALESERVKAERAPWLTPDVEEYIARVEYEYHVRAFGEEMARVNSLPLDERRSYIHDMIDFARSKGVEFDKPARGVTR